MSDALTIGSIYLVNSDRKGTFMMRLTHCDQTWATGEIVGGVARAKMDYNAREKGEEVTVRRAFCRFTEQPQTRFTNACGENKNAR